MRFVETWRPSKYVLRNGRLRITHDQNEVSVGSRLCGDLIAGFFYKHLKTHATGRLIDIGCGKVPLFGTYREYVTDVICIDWIQPEPVNYADMECDLGNVLPFNDNSFDTIILSDVLEHVPNPELLWSELSRITAPQGKLLLSTPFMYCLHEQPHDYHRFTRHALNRLAHKNGFDVITIEALGGTPEVLADILSKHLQFIPLVGKSCASLIQWITLWFVNTSPGKRLSKKTSTAFPLEYAMVAKRVRDNNTSTKRP